MRHGCEPRWKLMTSIKTHAMDDEAQPSEDPELCVPVRYGPVEADFIPGAELPPQHLIGNVNIVPFVGEDAVVLRVVGGRPEIPGGTLEPGEDHMAALHRELREEAGANLLSWTYFGASGSHSVANMASACAEGHRTSIGWWDTGGRSL